MSLYPFSFKSGRLYQSIHSLTIPCAEASPGKVRIAPGAIIMYIEEKTIREVIGLWPDVRPSQNFLVFLTLAGEKTYFHSNSPIGVKPQLYFKEVKDE